MSSKKTITLFFCRDYLKDYVQQKNPDTKVNEINEKQYLFINGRVILNEELVEKIKYTEEKLYTYKNQIIAAFLQGNNVNQFVNLLQNSSDLNQLNSITKEELEKAQKKEDKELDKIKKDEKELKEEERKDVNSEMPKVQEQDEVSSNEGKSEGEE